MDPSSFEPTRKATETLQNGLKDTWLKQTDILRSLRPTFALQEQLTRYAELAQRGPRTTSPLRELSDSLREAMGTHGEALRAMQRSIDAVIKLPLLEFAQNLPSVNALEGLRSTWVSNAGSLAQAAYEFGQRVRDSQAVNTEPVLALGWHLTPCMGFSDLFEALALPTDDEKDAYLSEQVKGYLEEIISDVLTTLSSIANRFGGAEAASHRRRHLAMAFEAHKAGQYALSIPALFAQVEGLAVAGLGEPLDGNGFFFSANSAAREKSLESMARAAGDFRALEAPLLGPSVYGTPIPKYFAGDRKCPNRHAVLHGRDLIFDTETNALKVITLLGYAVWLISEIELEPPKTEFCSGGE